MLYIEDWKKLVFSETLEKDQVCTFPLNLGLRFLWRRWWRGENLTAIKMLTVYEIKYLEELHNGKVFFKPRKKKTKKKHFSFFLPLPILAVCHPTGVILNPPPRTQSWNTITLQPRHDPVHPGNFQTFQMNKQTNKNVPLAALHENTTEWSALWSAVLF